MEQAAQFEATAAPKAPAHSAIARSTALAVPNNPRLFGEVFGFAFASSLGDPTIGYPSWNFALLSTVAYFGLHVSWTGDISDDSALSTWNNPYGPTPGLISTAHSYGTKVVLTIMMFDSTAGTPNMCSALQRGALTIQRTVSQVIAKGIDGVNIDYESNNSQCTDPSTGAVQSSQSLFTAFVGNMRAALPAGSYLSVDTYSGAAGYRNGSTYLGFFDIGALANFVDSFFIMAYDMEYANWDSPPLSCPNFCISPTAPITTYLFNDSRASSEYRAVVPASKIIMGIPYYGRKVCVGGYTPSTAPPNAVGSTVPVAEGYLDTSTENGYYANSDYQIHRETRDAAGATRWDTFTSSTAGCTREMYWDDVTSLGNKYNMVINDRLRGIGIFALNYGGGAPELWSLINLKFGQCSQGAIGADHTSPQIPGTSIKFTGSALCAGTAQYRFWDQPPGGVWTQTQPYGTSANWTWDTTGKPLGTYQIVVHARNLGSSASYDTYGTMPIRLALCVTPSLTTDHPTPQLPGTAIDISASVTCRGTPEYQFSMQPPGGAWSVVQPYGGASTFHWDTSHSGYGDYNFSVSVRTVGTSVVAESTQLLTYSLTSCILPSLTADKSSPQPTGTQVGLTGTATCAGTPQYRFMIQPPGGPSTVVQDFGSSGAYAWNAGGPGGTYTLEFDARTSGAPPTSMVKAGIPYDLASCGSASIAAGPLSPQLPGASVLLTGSATCPGTAQYRFWVMKPNAGWTVARDYGLMNTYSWDTTGLPIGAYGIKVDVRNVGATSAYEVTASDTYTLAAPACSIPTLSSDVASPQGTGAVVTFSATTSACPHPLFKFWVQSPDLTWTVVQDYSTVAAYRWPASGPAGNWRIEVDVRDVSRPVTYDQFAVTTYVITACSSSTLSANLHSPQSAGTQVVFTGAATCPRTAEFRFLVQLPSATWIMVQDYSPANTFTWRTTAGVGGSYRWEVDVRDRGAAAAYESFATLSYVLVAPCARPSLGATPASPGPTGATVVVSASTSNCPTPNYRFWIGQSGTWTMVQDYSPASTFSWHGTGLAGSYGIEVDVRDQSSSIAYDAVNNITYQLNPCASAGLSANKSSPQAPGATILLTAGAGCPGTPEYRFWVKPPGGAWGMVRDYSPSNTFSWNTAALAQGSFGLVVHVRNQGATAAYETYAYITYLLAVVPCTTPSLGANPPATAATGATVVFTASTSGCPTPNYRFWVGQNGGWTILQDYSPTNTFSWHGTGVAGAYGIEVDVRDASSTVAYDHVANIGYTLVGCSGAHLVTDKASPQAHGTTIVLTGSASCPGTPEYRFWVRGLNGVWTIVRDFNATNTFSWNTTGLAPGIYGLEVDVRNQGSTAAYETVANITFVVS